jgi:hypothetical protein
MSTLVEKNLDLRETPNPPTDLENLALSGIEPEFQDGELAGWLVVLGCFIIAAVTGGLR